MLQIALLDDKKELLTEYETYIDNIIFRHELPAKVVCATKNIDEFLDIVYSGEANICFIDMDLGTNRNGLSIAEDIRNKMGQYSVEIIFVTGFAQFMQAAFSVKPFNYLMKPAKEKHFERELLRLKEAFSLQLRSQSEFLIVNSKAITYKFVKDEIIFLEHDGEKTVVHTLFTDACVDVPLYMLIDQLDKRKFIQCHRSIYVSVKFITKMDFKDNIIYLQSGHTCYLSRKYKKMWKEISDGRFLG